MPVKVRGGWAEGNARTAMESRGECAERNAADYLPANLQAPEKKSAERPREAGSGVAATP